MVKVSFWLSTESDLHNIRYTDWMSHTTTTDADAAQGPDDKAINQITIFTFKIKLDSSTFS